MMTTAHDGTPAGFVHVPDEVKVVRRLLTADPLIMLSPERDEDCGPCRAGSAIPAGA